MIGKKMTKKLDILFCVAIMVGLAPFVIFVVLFVCSLLGLILL